MPKGIGQLNIKLTADNKRLARDLNRAKKKVGSFTGRMRKGMMQAAMATVGLTVAISKLGSVISNSIRNYKEWETGQANVQTLLEKTDKTLESRSIKLMKKHGLAVGDLNKALFDAVSAGVSSAKSIAFLDKVSKLAIGGVTDLTSSVDGVTSVMNAYGLGMEDVDRITAAFFTGQKFGKTTVAELTQEIGRVAPIAKLAGVTYQELIATYAELTKQGINTTDSTTAIKAIITSLTKVTPQAAKEFERLGIETGAAAIRQNGLFKTMMQVAKAGETDIDVLTKLIPNVRALTAAGALSTDALEDHARILEIINNDWGDGSSIMRAYETQMATLAKKTDLFKAKMTAISIVMGAKLAPVLIKGMELTEKFGNYLKKNASTIGKLAKVIGIATGAWVTYKVVTIAWSKATLFTTGITKAAKVAQIAYALVISKVTGNLKRAAAAQRLLAMVSKSTPWGLVAAAVAAVVTAIVVLAKKTTALTVAQKQYNASIKRSKEAIGDFNKNITTEATKLDLLFTVLKSTKEGSNARAVALETINTKYKDYLPNLLTEKSTLQEIETAQRLVNDALIKQIAIKSKANEIQKVANDYVLKQKEVNEGIIGQIREWQGADIAGIAQAEFLELFKTINETGDVTLESLRTNEKLISDFASKYKVSATDVENGVYGLTGAYADQQQAIGEIDSFYQSFIETLKKVDDATVVSVGGGGVKKLTEGEIAALEKRAAFEEEYSRLLIENIQDRVKRQIAAENDRHTKQKKIYENDIEDKKLRDKLIEQEAIRHTNNLKKIAGEPIPTALEKAFLVFSTLEKDLKTNVELSKLLGDSFDVIGNQVGLMGTALSQAKEQLKDLIDPEEGGYQATQDEIQKLIDKIIELELALGRAGNEGKKGLGKIKDTVKDIAIIANNVLGAFETISNAQKQKQDAELDQYLKLQDTKKEKLQERLDAGLITEKQYAEGVELIDKTLSEKKAEYAIKSANQDKSIALIRTIINTAAAVAASLPNIPLAIAVGVLGAAQLAVIQGTAIPALAKGAMTGKGITALVGEYPGASSNPEIGMQASTLKNAIDIFNRPTITNLGEKATQGDPYLIAPIQKFMNALPKLSQGATIGGSLGRFNIPKLASGAMVIPKLANSSVANIDNEMDLNVNINVGGVLRGQDIYLSNEREKQRQNRI